MGFTVLSLFDGISCGQLAFQRAGIPVDTYLASELDKKAISITQRHFPNTIQLGDVSKIDTTKLPKIDFLIGGSPCQGFSAAGLKLNFDDPRSKLFFEYVRILNEVQPKYFFLENVIMKREWIDVISNCLKTEPVEIDSALVSKQRRKRLYWANFRITQPRDKHLYLNRWVYLVPHGYQKKDTRFMKKYPTLTTLTPSCQYLIIEPDNTKRGLTPEECEELQTLPIGYTTGISKLSRYKAIGNCWTVDVISHILKCHSLKGPKKLF